MQTRRNLEHSTANACMLVVVATVDGRCGREECNDQPNASDLRLFLLTLRVTPCLLALSLAIPLSRDLSVSYIMMYLLLFYFILITYILGFSLSSFLLPACYSFSSSSLFRLPPACCVFVPRTSSPSPSPSISSSSVHLFFHAFDLPTASSIPPSPLY
eukprot:3724937-Pleurochrysis_carterae.AAC.1